MKSRSSARGRKKSSPPPAAAWPPFFSPLAPTPALWRGFWPCLGAAFLLRVVVGVGGEWTVRADEVFQYLEQAHRWVFGYGQVTWEYRIGARSWLLPSFAGAVLLLCKALGAAHPDAYIPAVKIAHAALSLLIPVGMYLFARRTIGETAARLALLFGCFWHEFVFLAAHAFAEQYATAIFFGALSLLAPAVGKARLLAAGFLLGLVVALRLPYLPTVGVFGLALLAAYAQRDWLLIFGGGVLALVLWGALDFFTWGRWQHSPRLYADLFFFNDIFHEMGRPLPPAKSVHLLFLAESSFGLYALAVGGFWRWRKNWILLALAATTLIFHLALSNQEYTNTFLAWPFLWMLIAATAAQIAAGASAKRARAKSGLARAPFVAGALALSATLAVAVSGVPGGFGKYQAILLDAGGGLRSEVSLNVARDLGARPAGEVRGVLWKASPAFLFLTGGHYYMHHRAPILWPDVLESHARRFGERDPRDYASHIVAPADAEFAGFSRDKQFGPLAVFVNGELENVEIPVDFETDVLPPEWAGLEPAAKRLGIWFRPPTPSLLGVNTK